MSLVVYGDNNGEDDSSVILYDPSSRSLVFLNQNSGEISLVRQIRGPTGLQSSDGPIGAISSFHCPQCGSEVGTSRDFTSPVSPYEADKSLFVHKNYFKLLEQNGSRRPSFSLASSFIPSDLFTPDYYRRFFQELSLLGNGARGSVYKVEHVLLNNHLGIYALKKIPIGNDLSWLERGIQEVKFLSSLTHKSANLITYNHVWLEMDSACGIVQASDGKDCGTPENIPCIFILQQFCPGGNLEDVIYKKVFGKDSDHESPEERKRKFKLQRRHKASQTAQRGLRSEQIVSIMLDLSSGLQELHNLNIIHRDLKPSNCLLLEEFDNNSDELSYSGRAFPTVLISDFGESQLCGQLRSATGATGTPEFTAPEVLILDPNDHSFPQFTFQSDMYSLGMICYFLVFGELPFSSQCSMPELKRSISRFRFKKEELWNMHNHLNLREIDPAIFDLMESLLSQEESKRPTAKETKLMLEKIMHKDDQTNSEIDPSSPLSSAEIKTFTEELNAKKTAIVSLHCSPILWNIANSLLAFFAVFGQPSANYLPYLCVFILGMSLRSSPPVRKYFFFVMVLLVLAMHFMV